MLIFPLSPEIKLLLKKEDLAQIKKFLLTLKITFDFWKEKLELSLIEMIIFLIYLKIRDLKYLSITCRKNLYSKLLKELFKNEDTLESFIIAFILLFDKITLNLYFFSPFNLTQYTYILISPPSLFDKYKADIIENRLRKIEWKYPETFVSIQLNLNTILFEYLQEQNNLFQSILQNHKDIFDKEDFSNLTPEEKITKGIEELKEILPYNLEEISISLKNFLATFKWKEFDLNKFTQINEFIKFGNIWLEKYQWKKKYIKVEEKRFLKSKSWKLWKK